MAHKTAMEQLVEEQERKWQSEIQTIRGEHEKTLTQLEADHSKLLADTEDNFQVSSKFYFPTPFFFLYIIHDMISFSFVFFIYLSM